MKLPSGRSRDRAFTLIEMMAVLAIIMVVAGLTVAIARYVGTKAAVGKAQAEIALMENALERYKIDNGSYPASGYANVQSALPPKYLKSVPATDPFGVAYQYLAPGSNNVATFDLWSYGPDRASSNAATQADDITNWKR